MNSRSFVFMLWSLAALALIGTTLADASGFRVNPSPSIPIGLWRLEHQAEAIQRGQVVSVCPANSQVFAMAQARGYLSTGSCPSGLEPLFKPVAAVAGDIVEVSTAGIAVNGKLLSQSAVRREDGASRRMPLLSQGRYQVASGFLWVISSYNPKSFDSRYFGPVSVKQVQGTLRPLWVKGSMP